MQFGIEIAVELAVRQIQGLRKPLLRFVNIDAQQQHFGHHRTVLRYWKEVHNARRLTSEVTVVRYPFHPLVGQSVGVIGSREHGGVRHLVIRRPDDGSKCLLPEWMTFSQAGAVRIVPCPRLSIHRLVELRDLIDRLMLSSSGTFVPGGQNNETDSADPIGSVQDTVVERTVRISTSESTGAAKGIAQGSDVRHRSWQQTPRSGGRR
jgi:hypothetical protein